MPDIPSVAPSLARIDRADEHLRDLATHFREFINRDAYLFTVETDPDSSVDTFTVVTVNEPPLPLRVRVGEIAHHLRAAFDLLVFQFMIHAGVTNERLLKACGFPVIVDCDLTNRKQRQEYEATMGRKIQCIRPEAATRIKGLQPCVTGDGSKSPMAQIDSLDNTDKHRLLLAVVGAVNISNWRLNDGTQPPITVRAQSYIPLKAGAIIKRHRLNPKMDMDFSALPVAIEITFGELGVLWNKPVIPTLQKLSDFARAAITSFNDDFL